MMKFATLAASSLSLVFGGVSAQAQADETANDCPPYEMLGAGPDLVLVPGLGSDPSVWDGVKSRLSEEYRVHLVHVAGFGTRAASGNPDTIAERSAAEIAEYLDCRGIESTAYAGHSMGGFLGLKLAIEHPSRINNLIVVDALPFYPLIFSPAATASAVQGQADALRAQILSQDEDAFAAGQQMGVRSLVRDPAYHGAVALSSIASDRATFAAAIHGLMTTDLRGELGVITTPTTVIAAANSFAPRDRVQTLYSGAYANLKNARLEIVEDSYHFIMFDQPERLETQLLAALARADVGDD